MGAMSSSVCEKSNYLEKRVLFWALLGPICILLTLSLGLFNAFPGIAFLTIAAFLGVFICFKWQQKGLVASIALLLAVGFFVMPLFTVQAKLWQIGLLSALILGLVVCNYSFIEAGSLFRFLDSKTDHHESKIADLKEKFAQIQAEWEEDRNALFEKLSDKQNEALKLRSKIRSMDREIEVYQTKITTLNEKHRLKIEEILNKEDAKVDLSASLEDLSSKNNSLMAEIQALKSSYDSVCQSKLAIENENIQLAHQLVEVGQENNILQEALLEIKKANTDLQVSFFDEKEALIKNYENEQEKVYKLLENEKQQLIEELAKQKEALIALELSSKNVSEEDLKKISIESRRFEGLYKQLKKQFEEKNSALEEARKELFVKENTLLETLLKIDAVNKDEDFYTKKVQKDYENLLLENQALEEETKNLEGLVSFLIESKFEK